MVFLAAVIVMNRFIISAVANHPCQSTYVQPVAGRSDSFIALFDRWKQWNFADSRYVWLPVEFAGDGRTIVRWRERWSLADLP